MNSGIWDQVGLEFSDIDVKGSIESEGGGKGRNDLGNESVEVGVGGSLNVEVSSGDVIDGLVVKHDSNISVFKERVG